MRQRRYQREWAEPPNLFWAYLLCVPCWALVTYCLAIVGIAKLSPASIGEFFQHVSTMLPSVCVIASPLCWLGASLVSYVHYRRTRVPHRLATTVVALSGAVMVTTWTILLKIKV